MKEIYFKIIGRVQGVGFRRFAVRTAKEIGELSGWVRNAEDGSVEVYIRGEEVKVEEMIALCRKGPLFGRVDNITFLPKITNYFLPPIIDGVFERI
ncbi:MAG: acylphosphatase [Alphaproteobacteria bacterium]|nr:acylphosphatase [Alphaproteobacteria bacterium]